MEGEQGMVKKKGGDANDVAVEIADMEEAQVNCTQLSSSNIEIIAECSTHTSSASSDNVAEILPQFLTRRKSAARSKYPSLEQNERDDDKLVEEMEEEEEEEEIKLLKKKENGILMKGFFIAFVCLMGLLIASLTVRKLQNRFIWDFKLWKWCVFLLVLFYGVLVAKCLTNVLVFFIERNFLLRKKFLYFVYGLKKIFGVFIWLSLMLILHLVLFHHGVKRSKETSKILDYATRALASSLAGATLWFLKTLSVKLLASSFLVNRLSDPIQESIFHQHILQCLSGPTIMKTTEQIGSPSEGKEKIDIHKLQKLNISSSFSWRKKLINFLTCSKLSTISNEDDEQTDYKEIKSELEAEHAADKIFANVAHPGCDHIAEEQLCRFMLKEEVRFLLTMFEGAAKTGKIPESEFKIWVWIPPQNKDYNSVKVVIIEVKAYKERSTLAHLMKQFKLSTQELDRLLSGIMIIVIIILWLLLMGFLKTQALVFILSQIALAAFMFGNTVKNIFESTIFLYVMRPFDIGDTCIIDGVQMVVDEIHILTTILVKYDNEKVFYPNSVLATKPVINLYRSEGNMRESVEFSIEVSNSTTETIETLNSRIRDYLKSKPEHWRPHHRAVVKEIEDANKIRMVLHVTHTTNYQNSGKKSVRRSKLVLQLKQIFDDIGISKYHVLPDPLVSSAASASAPVPAN